MPVFAAVTPAAPGAAAGEREALFESSLRLHHGGIVGAPRWNLRESRTGPPHFDSK